MSRVQMDAPATNFVLGGSGTWVGAPAADQLASYGGTLSNNSSVGATATVTPTTNAQATAFILGCARNDGATQIDIAVNGVVVATWSLWNGVAAGVGNNGFHFFRTLSPPIALPTGGAIATITLTNVSGGAMALDGAEFFTPEAVVANRVTGDGHSWMLGYDSAQAFPIPLNFHFLQTIAARLGMVEDNQGVNNEDMTNGGNNAAAVTDVQTISFDATGGTFQGTLTNPATGATGTFAATAWNATAATLQTNIRALGAPWAGVTVTGGAGAAFVVTMAGVTGYVPLMTLNTASLTGGTNHTAYVGHTTQGSATSNPQYNPQGNAQPAWVLAEQQYGGANNGLAWSRNPAVFVLMHGINNYQNWLLLENGNGGGVPAAGPLYEMRRYRQRQWEILARVHAQCPAAELYVVNQPPSLSSDPVPQNTGPGKPYTTEAARVAGAQIYGEMNLAIALGASDPLVPTTLVDVSQLLGWQNGGIAYQGDNAHPVLGGHTLIANAFMEKYRQRHQEKYGGSPQGAW
jgi:hypothetical protein